MLATLILAGTLAVSGDLSESEPHLAIRTGLACSACHVNRSGGGKRTIFGGSYGQSTLPRSGVNAYLNPAINDFLSMGADIRFVGRGLVTDTTPRTTLEVEEANIFVEARLLENSLTLYLDQTVGPNRSFSREAFALFSNLPLNGYAKLGKFLLPFGMRLQDDRAFIRERTGFSYQTPDQGVEVGIEPGPLTWFLSLTNGSAGAVESDDGKQVTTSAAFISSSFRLGVSASHNSGANERNVFGGFGGFRVGAISVMGELDYIFDTSAGAGDVDQFAAYGSVDFLATRGVNAKITYGYLDPDREIPENERTRLRFGVEYFPRAFWSIAGFYTILEDIPQARTDRDQVSLELHVFF